MSDLHNAYKSLVESEYAAIYGYGVIAGKVHKLQRKLAIQGLATHRQMRNLLVEAANNLTIEVPPAKNSYTLLTDVTSSHSAVVAATDIELKLCSLWAATAIFVTEEDRSLWAIAAQDCARRAYQWSKLAPSFPS